MLFWIQLYVRANCKKPRLWDGQGLHTRNECSGGVKAAGEDEDMKALWNRNP